MHISHNDHHERESAPIVIFGCGNILLGDDGFGPAVIKALSESDLLPRQVQAYDAGTAIREYLLDYLLLPSLRPDLLIVVDTAYSPGDSPGRVRVQGVDAMSACKIHDFSLHQFPTVNLLAELEKETRVQVIVVTVQPATCTAALTQELSPAVASAVAQACLKIQHLISVHAKRGAVSL